MRNSLFAAMAEFILKMLFAFAIFMALGFIAAPFIMVVWNSIVTDLVPVCGDMTFWQSYFLYILLRLPMGIITSIFKATTSKTNLYGKTINPR